MIQTGNTSNGHLCILIQNTDAPSQGAVGGGACINGGGFNNLPGYAAFGAGYTGDMGTLIARSTGLGGMFIQNGVFDFENQTGATVGMAASVTSKFRVNTTGSAQFPTAIHFSSLGTPANGVFGYCDDCTPNVAPCTGSGTGAIAKRSTEPGTVDRRKHEKPCGDADNSDRTHFGLRAEVLELYEIQRHARQTAFPFDRGISRRNRLSG